MIKNLAEVVKLVLEGVLLFTDDFELSNDNFLLTAKIAPVLDFFILSLEDFRELLGSRLPILTRVWVERFRSVDFAVGYNL